MTPRPSKLQPPITYQSQTPDYMALLPMVLEDINQLDHLLRGADGQKGLLERVGVLESTVADIKIKIDVIYEHIINTPKPESPEQPKPDENKLSIKSLWPVLVIALTALMTAIIEYFSKKP